MTKFEPAANFACTLRSDSAESKEEEFGTHIFLVSGLSL